MTSLPLLAILACTPVLKSPPDTSDTGAAWVPPVNSWPTATPPSDLDGQGYAEGQVAPDFRMPDQFGAEVSLWQFYGSVVVVDFSTMYCAPCQTLASGANETFLAYRDQGFMYLTVLSQNMSSEVPSTEDLAFWADYYGIEAPVLADDGGVTPFVVSDNTFPRILVIGRDMVVQEQDVQPPEDAAVRAAVEAAL